MMNRIAERRLRAFNRAYCVPAPAAQFWLSAWDRLYLKRECIGLAAKIADKRRRM